jgi:YggT family protein
MVVPLIQAVFGAIQLAILARVLVSWIDPVPYPNTRLKEILWSITEPILAPARRYVPPLGMMDISPIVVIVVLRVIENAVLMALVG